MKTLDKISLINANFCYQRLSGQGDQISSYLSHLVDRGLRNLLKIGGPSGAIYLPFLVLQVGQFRRECQLFRDYIIGALSLLWSLIVAKASPLNCLTQQAITYAFILSLTFKSCTYTSIQLCFTYYYVDVLDFFFPATPF